MTIGGTLTVLVMAIAVARLQSSLTARDQPRCQPAIAVILHALTSGYFALAAGCVITSLTLAAIALLTGSCPWATAIRARPARSSGREHRHPGSPPRRRAR
jgi:multisubunit Na+/H+ antiporter MnhG subunit